MDFKFKDGSTLTVSDKGNTVYGDIAHKVYFGAIECARELKEDTDEGRQALMIDLAKRIQARTN